MLPALVVVRVGMIVVMMIVRSGHGFL
jgi:hypothetical protein